MTDLPWYDLDLPPTLGLPALAHIRLDPEIARERVGEHPYPTRVRAAETSTAHAGSPARGASVNVSWYSLQV